MKSPWNYVFTLILFTAGTIFSIIKGGEVSAFDFALLKHVGLALMLAYIVEEKNPSRIEITIKKDKED